MNELVLLKSNINDTEAVGKNNYKRKKQQQQLACQTKYFIQQTVKRKQEHGKFEMIYRGG
ncbi:hypothetical protein JHU04_004531 [Brenneria sp. 4F2]|nr:hypothetical protein [Brenneria bubanii]